MRTRRLPDGLRTLVLAVAAAALVLLVAAAGTGGERIAAPQRGPGSWRGLVGDERAAVAIGQRMIVVLKAPSLAQHLAAAGGTATEPQERAWTASALATQAHLLAFLAANGVFIQPEFHYARVLNGFSAPLDPRAVGLLERSRDIAGVYPVRVAYPAAAPAPLPVGASRRADVELPGYEGAGVTIALLDTGVDSEHRYLRGRVIEGFDVLQGDTETAPSSNPEDTTILEQHGTEIAGLLVGRGGPGGIQGTAPGATVLPIRVAGWQPDANGHFSLYARSDQLLAGLERAVDPNDDGDAHDAARIALVPLAIPFASFTESPEARAVDGAAALDTLVVAAAGNDGAAGPSFGSIAGPGGAASALTVGALDARSDLGAARVVLRRGLQVLYAQDAPLLNAVQLRSSLNLEVGAPQAVGPLAFFDRRGHSLVAGKAALVPAGENPSARAREAARAGAAAILLYGDRLPAGGLGLDQRLRVPILSLPAAPTLALLAARRAGSSVGVSIGHGSLAENDTLGEVAGFSSRGLAFDGRVKPELLAPGVGLVTSEVGGYATVNGTSAAAAVVAGAAALLAEARPSADAAALKGMLVGAGRPIGTAAATVQGGAVLDVGAAAAAELTASPSSIGFASRSPKSWKAATTIVVRNVSSRRVRVRVASRSEGGESELLAVHAAPLAFVLKQGESRAIRVGVKVVSPPGAPFAGGSFLIAPEGGRAVRVPWVVSFRHPRAPLLSRVRLSRRSFQPSDQDPALLSFRAGSVVETGGVPEIQPLARLDLRLIRGDGRWLGVVGRLHDVLPGRFSFGITGRDAQGTRLPPGAYRLQLVAWPVSAGPPARVTLPFAIE